METLQHSCFFRRFVFCSVVNFFQSVSEIALQRSDIVTVCKKNKEAGQITPLSSLNGIYIAWSFLFVSDVIHAFERKASAFIVCSAQAQVSYMSSCGRKKL